MTNSNDRIQRKLAAILAAEVARYRSLGIQSLKNIAIPIEAYTIELNKDDGLPPAATISSIKFQ
jgi:hypothetical protein